LCTSQIKVLKINQENSATDSAKIPKTTQQEEVRRKR